MYEVIRQFCDREQSDHIFEVGDKYPLEGYTPSKERISNLANGNNEYGEIYIKSVGRTAKKEKSTEAVEND